MQLPRSKSSTLLTACLLTCSLATGPAFAGSHATRIDPAPKIEECATVKGPMNDGKEVYFEAANHCSQPRHCRVWVNYTEPPQQVHLEAGASARIDVGKTEPGDKFSHDCVPVSPGM